MKVTVPEKNSVVVSEHSLSRTCQAGKDCSAFDNETLLDDNEDGLVDIVVNEVQIGKIENSGDGGLETRFFSSQYPNKTPMSVSRDDASRFQEEFDKAKLYFSKFLFDLMTVADQKKIGISMHDGGKFTEKSPDPFFPGQTDHQALTHELAFIGADGKKYFIILDDYGKFGTEFINSFATNRCNDPDQRGGMSQEMCVDWNTHGGKNPPTQPIEQIANADTKCIRIESEDGVTVKITNPDQIKRILTRLSQNADQLKGTISGLERDYEFDDGSLIIPNN